jgi:uncharacterized membrane protein
MKDRRMNILIYGGMLLGAVVIGGNVVGYAFSGLITLLSFVFLVESIPALKWCVAKTTYLIDIVLFIFAVYAKVHFGVTLAMALMFGTIGFTLLYAPYVRETYDK